ncbi:MAG: hypothetical protein Q9207_000002 [Kuettlingeria erythrocarpa]
MSDLAKESSGLADRRGCHYVGVDTEVCIGNARLGCVINWTPTDRIHASRMQSLIFTPTATLVWHNNIFRHHDHKAATPTASPSERDTKWTAKLDVSGLPLRVESSLLIAKDRLSIPLNNVLSYHVPGTTINLYLVDTGDRLPLEDITGCLRLLRADIAWYIRGRIQSLSTTRIVGQNNVRVVFTPRSMTWTTAERVIDALETVITNQNWTWNSYVTISDIYVGLLGSVGIHYRAPGLNPLSSESNDLPPTSPTSGNSTLSAGTPRNTTLRVRPESPYPYAIPGSQISILCAGYGPSLDQGTVFAILLAAHVSVSRRVKEFGPLATVDRVNPWKLDDVVLGIWPKPDGKLRWYDLLQALDAVTDFVTTFETFAFSFEIRWQGYRSLGIGQFQGKG